MDFIRQYHWEYGTSSIKFNNEQFELIENGMQGPY